MSTQTLATEYQRITTLINQRKDCFITISVRYYKWWKIIAHIITLAALLKGRNNKYSHTALICQYGENGEKVKLVEAVKTGIEIEDLYSKYFTGKFKGEVLFQFVRAGLTKQDRKEIMLYIKGRQNKKHKYGVHKAFKAWFDWGKDQKDTDDIVYCTGFELDIVESVRPELYLEITNNAEITPSQRTEIIRKRTVEEALLNTRKLK